MPAVVAISDLATEAEVQAMRAHKARRGSNAVLAQLWAKRSREAKALAKKIETIAKRSYRANEVPADALIRNQVKDCAPRIRTFSAF